MAELVEILVDVILPLFLLIGAAFLIGRALKPDPRTLSTILIYLFIPALAFRTMVQFDLPEPARLLETDLAKAFVIVLVLSLVMMGIGQLFGRLLNMDRSTASAFTLSVTQMNAGNYGTPLNTFAFGAVGGAAALLFYVSSAIIGSILGTYIASRGSVGMRAALINVVRVPTVPAAFLGLLLNALNINVPVPVERAAFLAADAALPGMIALLGLLLARLEVGNLGARWRWVALACAIRLLVGPIIGVVLATVLGLTGIVYAVAIVQCSVPTAVMANAMASEFGGDTQFIAASTLISTLASVITLSILIAILRV